MTKAQGGACAGTARPICVGAPGPRAVPSGARRGTGLAPPGIEAHTGSAARFPAPPSHTQIVGRGTARSIGPGERQPRTALRSKPAGPRHLPMRHVRLHRAGGRERGEDFTQARALGARTRLGELTLLRRPAVGACLLRNAERTTMKQAPSPRGSTDPGTPGNAPASHMGRSSTCVPASERRGGNTQRSRRFTNADQYLRLGDSGQSEHLRNPSRPAG